MKIVRYGYRTILKFRFVENKKKKKIVNDDLQRGSHGEGD